MSNRGISQHRPEAVPGIPAAEPAFASVQDVGVTSASASAGQALVQHPHQILNPAHQRAKGLQAIQINLAANAGSDQRSLLSAHDDAISLLKKTFPAIDLEEKRGALARLVMDHSAEILERFPFVYKLKSEKLFMLNERLKAGSHVRAKDLSVLLQVSTGASEASIRTLLTTLNTMLGSDAAHLASVAGWPLDSLHGLRDLALAHPDWLHSHMSALTSIPAENSIVFFKHQAISGAGLWDEKAMSLIQHVESEEKLVALLPLMEHGALFLHEAMPDLAGWNAAQCTMLDMAVRAGKPVQQELISQISNIEECAGSAIPFAAHDVKWAMDNAAKLHAMKPGRAELILKLADLDFSLVAKHFAQLAQPINLPLLSHILETARRDIRYLEELNIPDLKKMVPRQDDEKHHFFLTRLYQASGGKDALVNPFVRSQIEELNNMPASAAELSEHGVSRSVLDKNARIESVWSERFAENQRQHPEITLGYEGEMFLPAGYDFNPVHQSAGIALNELMGVTDFSFKDDESLKPNTIIDKPFEINKKFSQPDSAASLQHLLAWLNAMNAHSNQTSGEHWHVGISQYTAAELLRQAEGKDTTRLGADVAKWDIPPGQTERRNTGADVSHKEPTPVELQLMTRFAINMLSVETMLASVQKRSNYARPNTTENLQDLKTGLAGVMSYPAVEKMLQPHGRDHVVNLNSYQKNDLKTLEVRGFTNKHAEFMDVDSTLPLINMVFMQSVMILTKQQVTGDLLSGAQPGEKFPLDPHPEMSQLCQRYVQDVLGHNIIHALQQDQAGKRKTLMAKIVAADRKLISPATIESIRAACQPFLADDMQARNFLDALENANPAVSADHPLRHVLQRQLSSRALSDRYENALKKRADG